MNQQYASHFSTPRAMLSTASSSPPANRAVVTAPKARNTRQHSLAHPATVECTPASPTHLPPGVWRYNCPREVYDGDGRVHGGHGIPATRAGEVRELRADAVGVDAQPHLRSHPATHESNADQWGHTRPDNDSSARDPSANARAGNRSHRPHDGDAAANAILSPDSSGLYPVDDGCAGGDAHSPHALDAAALEGLYDFGGDRGRVCGGECGGAGLGLGVGGGVDEASSEPCHDASHAAGSEDVDVDGYDVCVDLRAATAAGGSLLPSPPGTPHQKSSTQPARPPPAPASVSTTGDDAAASATPPTLSPSAGGSGASKPPSGGTGGGSSGSTLRPPRRIASASTTRSMGARSTSPSVSLSVGTSRLTGVPPPLGSSCVLAPASRSPPPSERIYNRQTLQHAVQWLNMRACAHTHGGAAAVAQRHPQEKWGPLADAPASTRRRVASRSPGAGGTRRGNTPTTTAASTPTAQTRAVTPRERGLHQHSPTATTRSAGSQTGPTPSPVRVGGGGGGGAGASPRVRVKKKPASGAPTSPSPIPIPRGRRTGSATRTPSPLRPVGGASTRRTGSHGAHAPPQRPGAGLPRGGSPRTMGHAHVNGAPPPPTRGRAAAAGSTPTHGHNPSPRAIRRCGSAPGRQGQGQGGAGTGAGPATKAASPSPLAAARRSPSGVHLNHGGGEGARLRSATTVAAAASPRVREKKSAVTSCVQSPRMRVVARQVTGPAAYRRTPTPGRRGQAQQSVHQRAGGDALSRVGKGGGGANGADGVRVRPRGVHGSPMALRGAAPAASRPVVGATAAAADSAPTPPTPPSPAEVVPRPCKHAHADADAPPAVAESVSKQSTPAPMANGGASSDGVDAAGAARRPLDTTTPASTENMRRFLALLADDRARPTGARVGGAPAPKSALQYLEASEETNRRAYVATEERARGWIIDLYATLR